ncbi:MAG: hypothetical protein JO063_10070 [Pseudonocardiales bacterium]|nr:hypothetical protein [Pseudonocardiales bacterium]MBV9030499.1 hypothetical protein [Pseudonocardiales bacterium]MBW0010444.1 hypothetical protein [Pseudonocardiales bacterium]
MTSPRTGSAAGAPESVVTTAGGPVQDNPGTKIPRRLRRRRAGSWRCDPLGSGLSDPWESDRYRADWTTVEVGSWQHAAEHPQAQQLYGRWRTPRSVLVVWRRHQACHHGGGAG